MFWYLFIIAATLIYYLYNRQVQKLKYWQKRNIPGPEPVLFFGNMSDNIFRKVHVGDIITNIYREYQDLPFVGVYRMGEPSLLIRDPDLLKEVTVKNFKNFTDNDMEIDIKIDPIVGRNPFFRKGEDWKVTRAQLTSRFTSGKIKNMFSILNDNSEEMANYIAKQKSALEMKELCTRFTLNNVAILAFGLEGKCFEENYSEFRDLADRFLSPGTWNSLKFTIAMFLPKLGKLMRMKLVASNIEDQLRDIVRKTIEYREKNNIVIEDFIHNMNQIRLSNKNFTYEDVTAQCAAFFLDGYESSSLVMHFILYELACDQKVQEKLREDIIEIYNKNGNKFTYEGIQELEFLDACIFESIRKNPIVGFLTKLCTENFKYSSTDPDFKTMETEIEKGTPVIIPHRALYLDEKYFEHPTAYMPERFLGEAKENIPKYVFMPFGEGPRQCLGMRFAMAQIKIGLVNVIKKFKLTLNNKTKLPLKYHPYYMMLLPIGGIWIDFEEIK